MAYFFKWIPLVVIAAVFVLSLPWLGLIALMVVAGTLVSLAAATVYVPYRFGRKVIHHWHSRGGAAQPVTTVSPSYELLPAYAATWGVEDRASVLLQPTDSLVTGGRDGVVAPSVSWERDVL